MPRTTAGARLSSTSARVVDLAGRVPLVGRVLRWHASQFRERSVVTIRTGLARGMRWQRSHHFVNGYWIGNYELPVQIAMQRLLRPGDVFWDVGANGGFFSLIAARLVGPAGEVVAFDPLPENVESIRAQRDVNALHNCTVVEAALSDAPGQNRFSFQLGNSSTAHLGDPTRPGESSIDVPVTTLDLFAAGRRKPTLLKIDVEGAEAQVLRGGRELLARGPVSLIELHAERTAADVGLLLQRHGYALEDLGGGRLRELRGIGHVVAMPRQHADLGDLRGVSRARSCTEADSEPIE